MNPDLSTINFGITILGLHREKKSLLEQKLQIEQRIEVIDRTVESLIFLGNPESKMPLPANISELGLQDAVRSIFRRSYPIYLLPTEVRATLVSAGTFGSSSKNLLIGVHTAISRIEGELETESRPGGKTAYRWKAAWLPDNAALEGVARLGTKNTEEFKAKLGHNKLAGQMRDGKK